MSDLTEVNDDRAKRILDGIERHQQALAIAIDALSQREDLTTLARIHVVLTGGDDDSR